MSEPKRYEIGVDFVAPVFVPVETKVGDWVKWEDYARLRAEVERLTKAGDAMAEEIALAKRQDEGSRFDPIEMHYDHELIVKWNAAKEGKQP